MYIYIYIFPAFLYCPVFSLTWCDFNDLVGLLKCASYQLDFYFLVSYRRMRYYQRYQLTNAAFGRDFETKAYRHILRRLSRE